MVEFVWLVAGSLPETNIFFPENGMVVKTIVSFWDGPFSGMTC